MKLKEIAEKSSRALGDDHHIRLGDLLQASREIGGLAHNAPVPPRATEAADHPQAGGDADADRERFFRARLEPRNSGNDIERRAHGSLGIVLMRAGIAEIGQYPVTPEVGKEAVKGERDTGAGGLKGIDQGAHVLWIE